MDENKGTTLIPGETQSLFEFLRRENSLAREALHREAAANRDLLLQTVKFASIPVSLLIVIATFLGYRSIDDAKQSLVAEAKRQTNAEIVHMQGVIDDRLNDEFKTPTLQLEIRHAAHDATTTAAEPLIKSGVANQVKLAISSNHGMIRRVAREQTDFYRIREIRAEVELVFSPNYPDVPGRFGIDQPTLDLSKASTSSSDYANVIQFTPLGGVTILNTDTEKGFVGQEIPFQPFRDELLNKPVSTLDGIRKLTLIFSTNAPLEEAKQKAAEFFTPMTAIDVHIFVNSVSLEVVRFTNAEI